MPSGENDEVHLFSPAGSKRWRFYRKVMSPVISSTTHSLVSNANSLMPNTITLNQGFSFSLNTLWALYPAISDTTLSITSSFVPVSN